MPAPTGVPTSTLIPITGQGHPMWRTADERFEVSLAQTDETDRYNLLDGDTVGWEVFEDFDDAQQYIDRRVMSEASLHDRPFISGLDEKVARGDVQAMFRWARAMAWQAGIVDASRWVLIEGTEHVMWKIIHTMPGQAKDVPWMPYLAGSNRQVCDQLMTLGFAWAMVITAAE